MKRLLAVLLAAVSAWILPVQAQEGTVVEVKVEGLRRVSEDFVLSRIALRPGMPWDAAVAARDLQRLYETDRFRQVDVDIQTLSAGLRVVFRVEESPFVVNIRFEGLAGLDREDLLSGMADEGLTGLPRPYDEPNAYYGRPLSAGRLADFKEALLTTARKKNFTDLEVDHRLEPREEGVDLVFEITERHEVVVEDLEITSDSNYSQRFIEKNTQLTTRESFFIFSAGIFVPSVLRDDIVQIQQMFRERGHYDVTVDATVTRQEDPPGFWGRLFGSVTEDEVTVRLHVREGPLYSVGDIQVSGQPTVFTEGILREVFGIRSGDVADSKAIFEGRERLQELYGDKGYVPESGFPDPVLTRIDIIFRPDARTRTVDLEIRIHEGQPITIRDLVIRGNERTRDEVIRREMLALSPGDAYTWSARKESLRRLENLGFFERTGGVSLHVDPRVGRTERDLILNVEETQTGSFNVGASVNSDGDVNANLSIGQTNFDVGDVTGFPFNAVDFFRNRQYVGKGQNFNLSLSPGTRTSTYSVSLFEPWIFGAPVGVGGAASFSTEEFRDWDEERLAFALTVARRWYLSDQQLLTIGVRLRHENIALTNVDDDAPSIIRNSDPDIRIRGLTPFISWDTRDNSRNPTEGQFHELHVERAGGFLGGLDFTRVSQRSAFYITLHENREDERHVLAVTSKVDWIEPYGQTGNIPISERFYLGGMRTLRGYRTSDIGPKENDNPLGGTGRHYGSFEYIVPLAGESLKGVAFVDYGALQYFTPTTLDDWIDDYRFGAGLGLRLIVPQVNFPLTLEVAEPIGPKSHGDERRLFNFSFASRTAF